MVLFDELPKRSLLVLLEKISRLIDPKAEFNLADNTEENKALFSDFLSILSFSDSCNDQFINCCFDGDKASIHRVIHYLLRGFDDFKQRAYLGQFLAPFEVPSEFMTDQEMRKLEVDLKELQDVFQREHQELVALRAMFPNKKQLESDIVQFETERDQLKVRISMFQNKTDIKDSSVMKDLLNATRLLRKEQEEENSLFDKLRTQKDCLERAETALLTCQQRFVDAQKSFGQEVA
jgi:hypothetical protein